MTKSHPVNRGSWRDLKAIGKRASGALLVTLLTAAGCAPPQQVVELPPIGVTVARPLNREVADAAYFTGRSEASEFVEVRARVSGYLTKMDFRAGTSVQKDQLLFEIDDRPYKASLEQAEGEQARAKAHADRLAADLDRARSLIGRSALSREDYDKIAGDRAEAIAAVRAADATIVRARLDMSWTKITAPIGGIVSRDLVNAGNLVAADRTLLTTIVKQDPIYVYFDVDENTVLRILELIRAGKVKSARENRVAIAMALANESGYPHAGYVNFVENRVDPATGTMRVRGTFENPPLANGPAGVAAGLFARVRLELGEPTKALLVTERAVVNDQGLRYLLIVNAHNEVERRDVRLGVLQGGLRVVEKGLSPDDRVIVNGLQRVRPGLPVKPTEEPMPESRPGAATTTQNKSGPDKAAPPAAPKK